MTTTPIYWVEGPWVGKLAIASRPRGGDLLGEEIQGWRDVGVNGVVSALTDAEIAELELSPEPESCEAMGLWFACPTRLSEKIGLPEPRRRFI